MSCAQVWAVNQFFQADLCMAHRTSCIFIDTNALDRYTTLSMRPKLHVLTLQVQA